MQAQVTTTIPFGAARSNCYLCNGAQRQKADGSRERMIDTGVHIDFEGHIAICETCIAYMAKMLGLLVPADVEEIVAELASTKELLELVVADRDRLQSAVDAYRAVLGLEGLDDEIVDAEIDDAPDGHMLDGTPFTYTNAVAVPPVR